MPHPHASATYPHVFQPLTIGHCAVRHRIMVTGHTQLYGADGTLSQRHIDYYRERAAGGAALLVLEQQAAHPSGRNYFAGCEAWDERVIPWYEKLGEAVHAHDCRQFVQLFACGAQGSGTQYIDDWRPLWAASRIPSAVTEEMPVAMEQTHIDELVEYFARSALNVKRAGLDGVEIHAAHSQLLGEFLSPAFNKRSDRYGGNVQARCRIVLEVGEAIRAAVGPDFTLGLRLSFDEYLGAAGITAEQSEAQIECFAASGLFDFFDISGGGYHTLHVAVAPMGTVPEAFLADSARRARAVAGDRAKIFVVGRFLDLARAEAILASGAADMVAMTRAHMADAHIVNKSAVGREADVVGCIGANVCVARLIENREVTCVQNPAMGRESIYGGIAPAVLPSTQRRRITVVGAGPAGLRFAGTAGARGHAVQVFEAGSEPGGRINLLKHLPTRASWQGAIDNLLRRLDGVDVELSLDTTIDNAQFARLAEDCDDLVLATGSFWTHSGYSPYRPERDTIPGHDRAFVTDIGSAIRRAIADPAALGKRVVIVDETGDYLALGLAEWLAQHGTRVDIISPRPFVGADTQRTLDMPHVMPRLKKLGVTMTALTFIEKIDDHAITIYDIWGGEPTPMNGIDTLVMAMTRLPRDELHTHGIDHGIASHRIGDVVTPRRLEAVIFEAEKLAREI